MSERRAANTGRPARSAGRGSERASDPLLTPLERTVHTDVQWVEDVSDAVLSDRIFQRVSARMIKFTKVDFKYCVFEGSYLRLCTFDSCDFTGCRFVGSSFSSSKFVGCKFDYAVFERTFITSDILDECCPSWENVKLRFARTLRTNYQSLGDSDAVNKAILVELHATRVHLHKAWRSNEPYYRQKYAGATRVKAFFTWLRFVAGDIIWGNGESASRLIRASLAPVGILALVDTLLTRNPALVADWFAALADAALVFLGIKEPTSYPGLIVAAVALTRYVILGLFVTVLVRRFARR